MSIAKISKLTIASMLTLAIFGCGQKSSEELIQNASNYIAAEQLDAAIIELKNAVLVSPNDAKVRLLLGQLYLQMGNLLSAEKEIQRAIDLGGDINVNVPLLAKIKYYSDQFDDVVTLADSYTPSEPSSLSSLSLYKLFSLHRIQTNFNNEEVLEPLLNSMNNEHKRVAESFLLVRQGEVEKAKSLIKGLVQQSLLSSELDFVQGLVASEQNNHQVAAEAFKRINNQIPSINSIDFLETAALIEAKNYALAETKVDQLYAISKQNPLVNLFKAKIEFDKENYEDAFTFASNANQNGLSNESCLIILAISAYNLEKWEAAYSSLSILTSSPSFKNEQLQRLFANIQLRLGYNTDAAKTLGNLSEIDLLDADLFAMTGLNLAYKGDLEAAKKLLRQANLADSENVPNQIREALLYIGNDEEQVISDLTKVLKKDPSVAQAWMQLAVSHVRNGDIASALKVADEWAEISKPNGMSLKGIVYMQSGAVEDAIDSFKKALSLEPQHKGARLFLLQTYDENEDYRSLYDSATEFLADDPANEPILLSLLRAANKLELLESTTLFIKDIVKNNKESIEPIVALALSEYNSNNFSAVVEILTPSQEKLTPLGFMTLGDSHIRLGDHNLALGVYETWVDANPSSIQPILRILGLYELAGENQKALEIAEAAVEKYPASSVLDVNLLRINYLTKLQRLDEAEALLEKIREQIQNNISAKLYEGQLALYKGKFVQAENLLTEYYKSKPNFNIALLLVKAMMGNAHEEQAARILEAELSGFKYPPLLMQATVGDFYIHNKMYTKAEAIYENMLSIDGQNSSYYNNLAWIKQSLNKLDEALVAAQSAMSLSEDNPYFMDTIGYIEYKRGNLDAAYKHLSRAAKMLPNVPDVQLHYSELLITLDFNQKAANILRQLKTQSPQQAAKKEQLLNSTK